MNVFEAFSINTRDLEWIKSFINVCLFERFAENIKLNTAAIDVNTHQNFISYLGEAFENIPSTHIRNLDETNITDNPDQAKILDNPFAADGA